MVALGKHAFYDQVDADRGRRVPPVAPVMAANAADADAQEGFAAFLEKRDPVWER